MKNSVIQEKDEKELKKIEIKDLINSENFEDFNPNLALVLVLDKLIDNFESKDIIPRNLGKTYALIANTNEVQKDLINEIIRKQNDNKGKVKKMYSEFIKHTLKSIKNNNTEKESRFQMLRR